MWIARSKFTRLSFKMNLSRVSGVRCEWKMHKNSTRKNRRKKTNSINIMKRSSLIAGFLPHALDVTLSQTKSFKCANWDVAVAVAIINHRKKNRLKTHVICFWHYHKSTANGTKTVSGSHQQQDILLKFRINTNRFNCWNQFAFILA